MKGLLAGDVAQRGCERIRGVGQERRGEKLLTLHLRSRGLEEERREADYAAPAEVEL